MTAKRNPGAVGAAYAGADHNSLAGELVQVKSTRSPELQAHIDRVVASAPPFSAAQSALVAALLGGDR